MAARADTGAGADAGKEFLTLRVSTLGSICARAGDGGGGGGGKKVADSTIIDEGGLTSR